MYTVIAMNGDEQRN